MKLVPLGDRIVLKQLEAEETTKSGIVLPGQSKEKPQQAEVIAEGKWKLRFDMRYEDIGTSVIDQPVAVQAEAGTAMLRAVYLSPLGFRITADYPEVNAQTQQEIDSFEMPESGREPQNTPYEKLTGLDIFLTLKDGTKLDLGTCMGSSCDL